MHLDGLDETDNKILSIIQKNARMSFSDIAEKIGVSRVSVRNRMAELEKRGIIEGYETRIRTDKVPGGVRFFLDIAATPEQFSQVADFLAGSREIKKIYTMSGDCMIHAEGISSSQRNLEVFSNTLYRRNNNGIRQIKLSVVVSTMMDLDGGVDYEKYSKHEHLEG